MIEDYTDIFEQEIVELLEVPIGNNIQKLTINGDDWEVDKQGNFTRVVYD